MGHWRVLPRILLKSSSYFMHNKASHDGVRTKRVHFASLDMTKRVTSSSSPQRETHKKRSATTSGLFYISLHVCTHLSCIQTTICKPSRFCQVDIWLGVRWRPILCLTAHKPKTDLMQMHSTQGSMSTEGHHQYVKKPWYFEKVAGPPAVGETTGRIHSVESEMRHKYNQASQRTTGKSTWMQGWSSFIIPWKETR